MSEMIERVAKAIYEGRNGARAVAWGRRDAAHKEPYLKDARAAIEAMRETTRQMRYAGIAAGEESGHSVTTTWSAMIDAALSPDP